MLARKLPNQLPEFQEVELSIIVLVQWAHKLVNGSRVISFLQENRKSHVSDIKKEPSQSVDNAKNSVNTGHVYGARDQRQAEHTGMQTSLKKKIMLHQQKWFGTELYWLCPHLVVIAIITTIQTRRSMWNFPHCG